MGGGRAPQYQEGRWSLYFHGLIFLTGIFYGTKSEKLTKPCEVFQMLALEVLTLDTDRTNTKLDEILILLKHLVF